MEKDTLDPRLRAIGERIRQLRMERGYSSYETFAFDHGLPRVGYGRHEKGANLTMSSLLRILDIHGLTLQEFFAGLDG